MKAAATAPLALLQPVSSPEAKICLFTDHLADFDYKEVATMLRQVGVGGADLTVLPGGLVKPERVFEDLPKAAAVFRGLASSRVPLVLDLEGSPRKSRTTERSKGHTRT